MHSASKVAAVIAFCALGSPLVGCSGSGANSASANGIAYVRLDDVVKRDPLYPQLAHMDDAITMVTLAGVAPRVPRSAAQIASEDRALRAQMSAAKARTQQIVSTKQRDYMQRERAAVTAALAAAGVKGASNVDAALGRVSVQQAREAQMQAGRDLNAYGRSVMQQGGEAARAIQQQLQASANQKLQAKALQEQQRETNLSLKLSQQDASQRLAIQTKLSMLALDAATRRQLQGELDAMTQRENSELAALRAADRREFEAYRATVAAQTNAAIRAQMQNLNAQTRAKLQSRQTALGTQLRNTLQPSQAAHLTPATQAQIRHIEQQFQQQYQTDVQGVIADYVATSDALEAQYATLHGADAAAAAAMQQEVSVLQQRRQALYGQIVARDRREAQRLAQAKGFRVVFSDVTAAASGYDMTNDLITDIESEHE